MKLTFARVVNKAVEKSIRKNVLNWKYIGGVVEGCRLRISCRASNLILKNEGSAYFVYAEY